VLMLPPRPPTNARINARIASPEKSPLAKFRAWRLRNPEGLKYTGLASESWRSPPPILNAAALSQVSPPSFQ
jgi:hypothetical protein